MADGAEFELQETASNRDPGLHRIVIVGGGAAGLELATRLGRTLGRRDRASITLVDKSRLHVWKPLLHEVASGTLESETDSLEYIAHARWNHYRYRIGALDGLDRARRRIHVAPSCDEDGRTVIPRRVIGYDTLVIAVGSVSNDFGAPGVAQFATRLDSLEEATRFNRRLINACLRANAQTEPLRPGQLRCAIIGAGATGVELAAELHKTMRDIGSYNLDSIDIDKQVRIDLIEAAPRVLPPLSPGLAEATHAHLRDLGINVRTRTRVVAVHADEVELEGGEFIPAELIVWAAGIKAPEILAMLDGLETDRLNRLVVRPDLRTTLDEHIYAIGDCAVCVLPGAAAPLPPRAQTAHQQASYLARAIVARQERRPSPAFVYRDFGSLVSLGGRRTFGRLLGGLRVEGLFARLMYLSLHRLHLLAVYGPARTAWRTLGDLFRAPSLGRVKLH